MRGAAPRLRAFTTALIYVGIFEYAARFLRWPIS
jgi:hypothetical protein